jgi:predicted AAA+ superfamily ATPase
VTFYPFDQDSTWHRHSGWHFGFSDKAKEEALQWARKGSRSVRIGYQFARAGRRHAREVESPRD